MQRFPLISATALLALLPACGTNQAAPPLSAAQTVPVAAEERAPVTILVAIDGFRADYVQRGITPNINALANGGITASMRPSFPSKTFPNHWTIVTGLRPDRHGITANRMEDPDRPGELFTLANDDPFWWNDAQPIWNDAERAGIRTATMFWPGSNVAVGGSRATEWPYAITGGTRPSDWAQFTMAINNVQRVNMVLDWARRPAATRPKLLTLYFDTVDTAGHTFGPDDARTNAAVAEVDQNIGALVAGLREMGQPANLVLVADHGMAETSSERTIALSELLPQGSYRTVESGPYAGLFALPGHERQVEQILFAKHDKFSCWPKQAIPARLHYGTHKRVPQILCLADTGWQILEKRPSSPRTAGNHGWHPDAPEMAALFVANGPAFKSGTVESFDNVDVYPLLRRLVGLPVASDKDGSDAAFRNVLNAND